MRNRLRLWACQFLVVLGLGFVALSDAHALDVGDRLPIDSLVTIDGKTLTRQDLDGHYLVVQVWATWCPFCHRQNMNLIELAKQTTDQKLKIIALSIDKNPQDVVTYAQDHDINFELAMMTPELDQAIGKRRGIPELYVLDPSGMVVQKGYGQMVDLDIFDLAQYGR